MTNVPRLPPKCRLCGGRKGWPVYSAGWEFPVEAVCTRCKGSGYEPPPTLDGKLLVSPPPPPKKMILMSKLFQIYKEDLAELEHILPQLAQRLMPQTDNCLRMQIRKVQAIITNVRWNYGPPTDVEVIPSDEPQ